MMSQSEMPSQPPPYPLHYSPPPTYSPPTTRAQPSQHTSAQLPQCNQPQYTYEKQAPQRNTTTTLTPLHRTNGPLTKPIALPQLLPTPTSPFPTPLSIPGSPLPVSTIASFLADLNGAMQPSPAFAATDAAGMALGLVPLHSCQLAGAGVQAAAGVGRAVATRVVAARVLKRWNASRAFAGAGVAARVAGTEAVCGLVGVERFGVPETEVGREDVGDVEAVLRRRMRALEGSVADVEFGAVVREAGERPGQWYKRIGAAQARMAEEKDRKKMGKMQEEHEKKKAKGAEDLQKKIAKYEEDLEKAERKAQRELSKRKVQKDPSERLEVEKDLQKEREKLEKKLQKALDKNQNGGAKESKKIKKKEDKRTKKLLWVVITNIEDGQGLPVVDESTDSDEESA